jgi:glycosyltransferase involved in cell wall biosynthesis
MTHQPARADLHVHTRFSPKAADWLLRKLEFPASTSDPVANYHALKAAGMRFVTFTDHNSIEACLAVAHLPDTFFGEEVTTVFPEDGCKVHLLVWGHDERQHREIQVLRESLYDMQSFLAAEGLAHAVAHPFHSPDEKLTALHMQKLALLFRHFESINGRYHARLGEAVTLALGNLTPRSIEIFAAKTGIEPTHDEPWRKAFVGGSDDHGGTSLARAWTAVEALDTEDFLAKLRGGDCAPGGRGGDPVVTAHGMYQTAYDFARQKFSITAGSPGSGLIEKAFSRFMEGRDPTEFTLGEKLGFLAQGIATGKIFEIAMAGNTTLWKELSGYFSQPAVRKSLAREVEGVAEPERRAFLMANLVANQLGYRFVTQFIDQIRTGKIIESIQTISPLAPLVAVLSPYLHALRMPRRDGLREMVGSLSGEIPPILANTRRAWFTDTLDDVNGVATTIRKMVAAGVATGHDIRVFVSRSSETDIGIPIANFPPVGEFELPEYELQSLSFPPILHILDHLTAENYSEIIISTPGPLGLCALYAAKALGLRAIGIYHTDFPQYVRILTDDSFMETLTWDYMHWFYSQLDLVFVNSEDYRKSWIERGIPEERITILPRGLDTGLFNAGRRDDAFWSARGLRSGEVGMLYVGRVSKEKNLDLFASVARQLADDGVPVRPLLVGDGPYRKQMQEALPHAVFTGYLRGEDLATAYASADFFLFPSTTDTFGNVILEAQACGLPVIVSDVGGPRDLVQDGTDGFVTRALDLPGLVRAASKLALDTPLRSRMGRAARERVSARDWSKAFHSFWHTSPE